VVEQTLHANLGGLSGLAGHAHVWRHRRALIDRADRALAARYGWTLPDAGKAA